MLEDLFHRREGHASVGIFPAQGLCRCVIRVVIIGPKIQPLVCLLQAAAHHRVLNR